MKWLDENSLVIQINGKDRPGLFSTICRFLTSQNINIHEVSQSVLRGFLSITFLLDLTNSVSNLDLLKLKLNKLARSEKFDLTYHKYIEGYRPKIRNLYVLTLMGPDNLGILYRISEILANYEINIETITTKVKSNWIYNQFLLDINKDLPIENIRNEIRKTCEELGLSHVLQPEQIYRQNKKLIVFDMDSTLVQTETMVEIAKKVNLKEKMEIETNKAMSENIDFKESLTRRLKLIKGIPEDVIIEIANNLQITPGAEELVFHLKSMGWTIAVVSSGFSHFTDKIKEKMNLDYGFGNTLEIIDNKITGNIKGEIIDREMKWEIIKDLAEELHISENQIVTVGDGSNDMTMLKKSGLGIGLNSKELVSEVADGRINLDQVQNMLFFMGLSETKIEEMLYEQRIEFNSEI